jgi:DNA-binding transcriptional MerR regulator
MLIGELSKQTGLSRDTIRFYEKQGLIAVGRKERRFNN